MMRVLLISNDTELEKEVAQLPIHNGRVERVSSIEQAESILTLETFPLCLLDQRMQGGKDAVRIQALRKISSATQVIVLFFDKAQGDVLAWDGNKTSSQEFNTIIQQSLEQGRLILNSQYCKIREMRDQRVSTDITGNSELIRNLRDRVRKLSSNTASVLIEAEPGVDAEMVARAIHGESGVKGHFVALNCGGPATAEMMLLLTGSEKESQPGVIELAAEGTLFLSDVQTMPPKVQDLLVRVLEEGEIQRHGGQRAYPVATRWITGSTVNLKEQVKEGSFREDLYWKLCGTLLALAPLRRRRDDIEELFRAAVRDSSARFSRKEPKINDSVIAALRAYDFPGNDLELRQLAEILLIQSEEEIGLAALPVRVLLERRVGATGETETIPIKKAVHEFERQIIIETLKNVRGNQSKASRRLSIHRNTLILKMQELGIPNKRQSNKRKK